MQANLTSPISIDAEQVQKESAELTILGAGAWGTALATLVEKNDHTVCLWSRRGELSLAEAVKDAHVILSAVSMKGVPL
ncbi:MAG: glycerol-3-phosphate dehydrogenase, partial [Cyanobacteria bacterium P01_H01_bin.152]